MKCGRCSRKFYDALRRRARNHAPKRRMPARARPSGSEMPRGGQACERICKLFTIERLDQKTVHAGFKAGVAILHQRVGREGKDWRLAARLSRLKATDTLGGFDAVELRHLDVHQNQII